MCVSSYCRLAGKGVILLLNKHDMLEERMKLHKLSTFFPDFTGSDSSAEDVKGYIVKKLEDVIHNSPTNRDFAVHFTSAIDTESTKGIFTGILAKMLIKTCSHAGL